MREGVDRCAVDPLSLGRCCWVSGPVLLAPGDAVEDVAWLWLVGEVDPGVDGLTICLGQRLFASGGVRVGVDCVFALSPEDAELEGCFVALFRRRRLTRGL